MLAMFAAVRAMSGELVRQTFQSEVLGGEFHYTIYIPKSYRENAAAFPVLYLLHGAQGSDQSWSAMGQVEAIADRLINSGKMPPMLIVMPGCRGCWWVDAPGHNVETAFWDELVPRVASKYRVIPTRDGRLIAGHSMGGYGAIRYALRYPERLVGAAAFSPAIYSSSPPLFSAVRKQKPFLNAAGRFNRSLWNAKNYPSELPAYILQPFRVAFYLTAGDHDRLGLAFETALFFKKLFEVAPESIELRIRNGGHAWPLWRQSLEEALVYLGRVVTPPREVQMIAAENATAAPGAMKWNRSLPMMDGATLLSLKAGYAASPAGRPIRTNGCSRARFLEQQSDFPKNQSVDPVARFAFSLGVDQAVSAKLGSSQLACLK